MLSNMLAARALVAERRHRYESEAELRRLRIVSRSVRHDGLRHGRRDRHQVHRLRPRQA
ncbi:MAG: hypothetical protein ACRD0A_14235 [Acidimicrobiales bacterium]